MASSALCDSPAVLTEERNASCVGQPALGRPCHRIGTDVDSEVTTALDDSNPNTARRRRERKAKEERDRRLLAEVIAENEELKRMNKHSAMLNELQTLKAQNAALLAQNAQLKTKECEQNEKQMRQISAQKLRNLIVLGKVKEQRRRAGISSSDEEDEGFGGVSSKPSSHAESICSSCEAEEEESLVDSDHESSTSSELSPIVTGMQTQMEAMEMLLATESFIYAVNDETLTRLQALLSRAREACHVFAEELSEHALAKWVTMLQKSTTNVIKEHPTAIIFEFGEEMIEGGVEGIHKIEPTAIWEALSWEFRIELLSKMSNPRQHEACLISGIDQTFASERP